MRTTTRARRLGRYVVDHGVGTPVLLIHGVMSAAHVWEPLFREAGHQFRFIAVDLPGCGRSGFWAEPTTRGVAEGLVNLLDDLRLSQVLVVGHSFGGLVGFDLTALAPERVLGLCVANSPGLGLPVFTAATVVPMFDWAVWAASRLAQASPRAAHAYLRHVWGDNSCPSMALVERYLEASNQDEHHRVLAMKLKSVVRYQLPKQKLLDARRPTALLFGEKIPLVPVAHGRALSRVLAGSMLNVVSGAGHLVPEERPGEVALALDWLAASDRYARSA